MNGNKGHLCVNSPNSLMMLSPVNQDQLSSHAVLHAAKVPPTPCASSRSTQAPPHSAHTIHSTVHNTGLQNPVGAPILEITAHLREAADPKRNCQNTKLIDSAAQLNTSPK
jgi:hypothetical protein